MESVLNALFFPIIILGVIQVVLSGIKWKILPFIGKLFSVMQGLLIILIFILLSSYEGWIILANLGFYLFIFELLNFLFLKTAIKNKKLHFHEKY